MHESRVIQIRLFQGQIWCEMMFEIWAIEKRASQSNCEYLQTIQRRSYTWVSQTIPTVLLYSSKTYWKSFCAQLQSTEPRLLHWKHLAFEKTSAVTQGKALSPVGLLCDPERTKLPFTAVDLCCEPDKNIGLVESKRLEGFQVQKS